MIHPSFSLFLCFSGFVVISACAMSSTSPATIGIDFGGTSIKLGVVRAHELVCQAPSIATQEYGSPEALIKAIAQFVGMLRQEHPDAKAIGLGMPGFVNFEQGTVFTLTNVPGWDQVNVRELMEKHCGLPTIVENDANCMAYAEWKLGAGKGKKHLICLTLGTGVGSGIIVDGKFLHGATCAAGELGQTSIDYEGRVGHYGTRGSLEDYIGHRELAADARALYAANNQDKTIADCDPITLERAALSGDPIAIKVWNELARKLACSLINCCYLLNPEAFVIGGGLAKAQGLLFDPLRQFMSEQLPEPLEKHLEILPAFFGTDAGVIGAAHLALNTFFPEEQ